MIPVTINSPSKEYMQGSEVIVNGKVGFFIGIPMVPVKVYFNDTVFETRTTLGGYMLTVKDLQPGTYTVYADALGIKSSPIVITVTSAPAPPPPTAPPPAPAPTPPAPPTVTVPQFKLSLNVNDTSMGSVAVDGDYSRPAGGDFFKEAGLTVSVKAVPKAGFVFDYWMLDGVKVYDNPVSVYMGRDHVLTAYFKPEEAKKFVLSVNVANNVMGSTDLSVGDHLYLLGEKVTVKAIPSSGYQFDYWLLDGVKVYDNPVTVTMDRAHSLTAYFKEVVSVKQYLLSASVNNTSQGYLEGAGFSLDLLLPEGASRTVKAVPAEGYQFDYWLLDGVKNTANPITVVMNRDHKLVAYFKSKLVTPPPLPPTTDIDAFTAAKNAEWAAAVQSMLDASRASGEDVTSAWKKTWSATANMLTGWIPQLTDLINKHVVNLEYRMVVSNFRQTTDTRGHLYLEWDWVPQQKYGTTYVYLTNPTPTKYEIYYSVNSAYQLTDPSWMKDVLENWAENCKNFLAFRGATFI